ncbi:MAG TPA: amidinotransferase [Anaerolineae bacterium]|nr:amidinotransferase [Anaerolineae bacterium]
MSINHFTHALTRQPAPTLGHGLTTANLGPPNFDLARHQHITYIQTLVHCGLTVVNLPPQPAFPDAHFVEDTAVIIPNHVAIITIPGAPSRQGETATVQAALQPYLPTVTINPPGTLDGGDVLLIDKHFFVGLSSRTNQAGFDQFATIVDQCGYQATPIPVAAGLHLKSSINYLTTDTIIVTPDFANHPALANYEQIITAPDEDYAANTLWLNDHLLFPIGYPGTRARLEPLGLPIVDIDTSEIRKMDGGLTCMSLRFTPLP